MSLLDYWLDQKALITQLAANIEMHEGDLAVQLKKEKVNRLI
jgi:hypothetical protein